MRPLCIFGTVCAALGAVRPEETLLLYRWAGQENVRGVVKPRWHAPRSVRGRVHSLGADELRNLEEQARVQVQRKVYLRADTFEEEPAPPLEEGAPLLPENGSRLPTAEGGLQARAADAVSRIRSADFGAAPGIGKTLLRRADGTWWLASGVPEDFREPAPEAPVAPEAGGSEPIPPDGASPAASPGDGIPAFGVAASGELPVLPGTPGVGRPRGWICLRITLQRRPPEGLLSPRQSSEESGKESRRQSYDASPGQPVEQFAEQFPASPAARNAPSPADRTPAAGLSRPDPESRIPRGGPEGGVS